MQRAIQYAFGSHFVVAIRVHLPKIIMGIVRRPKTPINIPKMPNGSAYPDLATQSPTKKVHEKDEWHWVLRTGPYGRSIRCSISYPRQHRGWVYVWLSSSRYPVVFLSFTHHISRNIHSVSTFDSFRLTKKTFKPVRPLGTMSALLQLLIRYILDNFQRSSRHSTCTPKGGGMY